MDHSFAWWWYFAKLICFYSFQSVNTSDSTSFKQRRKGEAERAEIEQKHKNQERLARSTPALQARSTEIKTTWLPQHHRGSQENPGHSVPSTYSFNRYIFVVGALVKTNIATQVKSDRQENIWAKNRRRHQLFGICSQNLGQRRRRWRRPIFATPSLVSGPTITNYKISQ